MLNVRMTLVMALIAAASIWAGYSLTPESIGYPVLRLVPATALMVFAVITGSVMGRTGRILCAIPFAAAFWVVFPSMHLMRIFGEVPVFAAFLTAVGGAVIGQTLALHALILEDRISRARETRQRST